MLVMQRIPQHKSLHTVYFQLIQSLNKKGFLKLVTAESIELMKKLLKST